MKIRNGFVSNSSSSSFIIGIARVSDEEKLNKYIKDNNISNVDIVDLDYIKKAWDINIRNNSISLESFMTDVTTKIISDDDKFILLDYIGGDDSDFWNGDYYDYDIDLTFFDYNLIKAYDLFNKKNIGIVDADSTYGAGRNG
jgi:hypothetical protein